MVVCVPAAPSLETACWGKAGHSHEDSSPGVDLNMQGCDL